MLLTMGDFGSEPKWVKWSRQLMGIAQYGLTYAESHSDRERYEQVRQVAAEIMAEQSETDDRKVLDMRKRAIPSGPVTLILLNGDGLN